MKYSKKDINQTYKHLKATASLWGAVIGALMGTVPAIGWFTLMTHFGKMPTIFVFCLLCLPALFIGFAARVTGRLYSPKHRIVIGLYA